MCKIDKDSLCKEINSLERTKNDLIRPIEQKYKKYIDDTIFQELPFCLGDILKCKFNNKYYIYKGIKNEYMVLYGCDKNGVEDYEDAQIHWTIYEDFEIHKEVE